jgi:8-oxo-dGTP pyrophosphatase MutT (NUDIX family)
MIHPKPNGQGPARDHHEPPIVQGPRPTGTFRTRSAPSSPRAPSRRPLNGIPFATWREAPTSLHGWSQVPGQRPDLVEPPFDPQGKRPAAGLIIEEPDGRLWIVCPTNRFAGCVASFPKGRADEGLSLQVTALKETFEETGLRVAITGLVGDFPGVITLARYYRARRIGGTPADMGWESQAVLLVPKNQLVAVVNLPRDQELARMLGG